MWIVGLLHAAAALAFVAAAVAWQLSWTHCRILLGSVALFSLALTLLDWRFAIIGTVINIGILTVLGLAPWLDGISGSHQSNTGLQGAGGPA